MLRAARCSQQDAQEFLKFFMDRLHAEINRKARRTPSILADTRRPPAPEDADTLRLGGGHQEGVGDTGGGSQALTDPP